MRLARLLPCAAGVRRFGQHAVSWNNRIVGAGMRLRRSFGTNSKSEDQEEFERIFRGDDQKTSLQFRTYEVYFLRRDLDLLRRSMKASVFLSGVVFGATGLIYYTTSWYLGLLAGSFFAIHPLMKAGLMWFKTRHVVSSIWLTPEKDKLELIYSTDLKRAKGPIENLKPVSTIALKTKNGFEVVFNFVDDLGVLHSGLNLYIDPRACEVDNLGLLTKVLAGQVEEVQKYEFVGDPETNKPPPS